MHLLKTADKKFDHSQNLNLLASLQIFVHLLLSLSILLLYFNSTFDSSSAKNHPIYNPAFIPCVSVSRK